MKDIFPPALQPYAPLITGSAYALVILTLGWIASKWTHSLTLKALRRSKVDEALSRFLASIAQYTALAAAVIIALEKVGVQTTSLVAILASAGLAVGLALQGSLSSFASGVMILFFRPFTLGDKVTAGGKTGVVQDIGLFATALLTPDNEKIILPNSSVTGGPIVNFSCEGTLRGTVSVGVAYGNNVNEIMRILEKAAAKAETVLAEPAPAIAFTGLGASSIDFAVMTWSNSGDYLTMLHNVRTEVYTSLNEAGVDIPYDQIVVHQAAAG